MKQSIFLIGFMGSGKSHWGHIWALKNGYTFYDLDTEIEKAFKMSVQEIFEKHGEDKFRELERYHLRKFLNKRKCLVSCGGGTPCFFDNLEWMKKHGHVIYLQAKPEYLLKRVFDETSQRPLLKEVNRSELLFFIEKKLKEREPVYLKADHTLDVKKLSESSLKFLFEEVASKIKSKKNEVEKEVAVSASKKSPDKYETSKLHHA